MAKKKAKPKLDPQLTKLQEQFTRHSLEGEKHHEIATAAAKSFADRSASLAGIQPGDFIAVSSYRREIPAVVLSVHASNNDWRDDDTTLTWKIRYQQVKQDGTPHNGHGAKIVPGAYDEDSRSVKWRKISKDVAAALATQQRV